jgi:hypothetical protein
MSTDRLRRELARLKEGRAAQPVHCQTCAEKPMFTVDVDWDTEPDDPAYDPNPPTPCPECGRLPLVVDVGWGTSEPR